MPRRRRPLPAGQRAAVQQRLGRSGGAAPAGTTRATRSRPAAARRRAAGRRAAQDTEPIPRPSHRHSEPAGCAATACGRLSGDADRPAHPLLGVRRHRDPGRAPGDGPRPRGWTSSRSPTTTRRPAGRRPRRPGPPGLTVVPGMELSCRWFPDDQPPISVHLLAYLFDPPHPGFAAERARLRDERLEPRRSGSSPRWPPTATRSSGSRSSRGCDGRRRRPAAHRPGAGRRRRRRRRSTTRSPPCCTTAARTTSRRPTPTSARASRWSARPAGCRSSPTGWPPSGAGSSGTTRSPRWPRPGCSAWRSTTPTTRPSERAHLRGLAADLGLIVTGSSDYHGTNKHDRRSAPAPPSPTSSRRSWPPAPAARRSATEPEPSDPAATVAGMATVGAAGSPQLEMPGMPRRLFSRDAEQARRLRRLPPPLPLRLRRPADAAEGAGLGAQHRRRRACTRRCARGGTCPVERRTTGGGAPAALRGLVAERLPRRRAGRAVAGPRGRLADRLRRRRSTRPTSRSGNERTVGATTERLALSGRVDRIDQRGDELVIVDYKTGRSVCTDDEARGSPALAAYVLGVAAHPAPAVQPGRAAPPAQRHGRLLRAHRAVAGQPRAAGRGHRRRHHRRHRARWPRGEDPDAAFPAVPGQQCSWCDFRPSCPTGQAAVPARETWSFLAEDDARA